MTPDEIRAEKKYRYEESVAKSKGGKPGEPTPWEHINALNDADEWEMNYNRELLQRMGQKDGGLAARTNQGRSDSER